MLLSVLSDFCGPVEQNKAQASSLRVFTLDWEERLSMAADRMPLASARLHTLHFVGYLFHWADRKGSLTTLAVYTNGASEVHAEGCNHHCRSCISM